MAYVGDLIAPLFTPSLASECALEMAEAGGDALLDYAIEATPVNYNPFSSPDRLPGTLKSRWRKTMPEFRVVRGSPAYEVRAENHDPIAPFVENDTRPHVIRPKNPGGALSFRLWPTGERVTVGGVKHPGTTGWHMTLKATNRLEVEFETVMDPPVTRWAKRQERNARRQLL